MPTQPLRHALVPLLGGAALLACSPTYNWRDIQPEGTPLQATLPCKPEQAERPVTLPAGTSTLHMQACEAGGLRYALAWMPIPPSAQADAVLSQWQLASLHTLGIGPEALATARGAWSWQVKGAVLSQAVQVRGSGPDGKAVTMQAVYFSHGDRAYQAAVYGSRLDARGTEPFFEALRLP